jgi:hypothetical protein
MKPKKSGAPRAKPRAQALASEPEVTRAKAPSVEPEAPEPLSLETTLFGLAGIRTELDMYLKGLPLPPVWPTREQIREWAAIVRSAEEALRARP